jgi:hypothetical protein
LIIEWVSQLVFSYKTNLVFMKNHYHQVAVASICTPLCFALAVSPEAKAASFNLAPTIAFEVIDIESNYDGLSFDGRGDLLFPGFSAVARGPQGEAAQFAEFNINSLSLVPNTIISNAIFQTQIYTFLVYGLGGEAVNPGSLGLFGYVGNGTAEASDFEAAGVFLSSVDVSSLSAGDFLNFDVTPFVNQRVSNSDAFTGFSVRALNFGNIYLAEPRLIVETAYVAEPVPEPTTIFGSAIGLCLGKWLKRKKSSQQNKTAPQP